MPIKGMFEGERFSDDLSSIIVTLRIPKENILLYDKWFVLGDEVTIS